MALEAVVTNLEELKSDPALACLLSWNAGAVESALLDRKELTIWVKPDAIREACAILRDNPACPFEAMQDLTCVDWLPREPRFEVVYHLLSIQNKQRIRLKVKVSGEAPAVQSVTSVWPSANFFEREVFDLFGIRFNGHPNLLRLLMPEEWEGHPLRKDYPVEGYR